MAQAPGSPVSSRYRRAASACGIFPANAISRADRDLLLRMQQSWLARAIGKNGVASRLPRQRDRVP